MCRTVRDNNSVQTASEKEHRGHLEFSADSITSMCKKANKRLQNANARKSTIDVDRPRSSESCKRFMIYLSCLKTHRVCAPSVFPMAKKNTSYKSHRASYRRRAIGRSSANKSMQQNKCVKILIALHYNET